MTGANTSGTAAAKAPKGRQIPKGKLPKRAATDWRRAILRTVAVATGLNAAQLSQILGTPERTARRDLLEQGTTNVETDQADDVDRPGTHSVKKPGALTPREIADLKSAYRSCDDPAVQAFLESLQSPR